MTRDPLPPSFTTGDAAGAGLSDSTLYRMRDRGQLVELSRGVWRQADAPPIANESLLAVQLRAPHGTICLLSALAVHDLTDEIPAAVDLAVPRGTTRPRIEYPPSVVHVFDAGTFQLGRHQLELAPGERIWIYEPARTVVDAVRLRNQIGQQLAYGAAKTLLERERAAGRMLALAKQLRCEGPVVRVLEVLEA
jgi:predicted transcriptional regulator of viral defense system